MSESIRASNRAASEPIRALIESTLALILFRRIVTPSSPMHGGCEEGSSEHDSRLTSTIRAAT